jgi:hypothetical protein
MLNPVLNRLLICTIDHCPVILNCDNRRSKTIQEPFPAVNDARWTNLSNEAALKAAGIDLDNPAPPTES